MLVNILGVRFHDVPPILEKTNVINPQKEWNNCKNGEVA